MDGSNYCCAMRQVKCIDTMVVQDSINAKQYRQCSCAGFRYFITKIL